MRRLIKFQQIGLRRLTGARLQAVRDDQAANGAPAAFSPDSERSKLHPERPTSALGGSAGWGDALVEVPWQMYRAYGDVQILQASWESMVKFAEYALTCAHDLRHPSRIARRPEPASHEIYIWDAPFHFGEWLEPKRRRADGTIIEPTMDELMTTMSADRGEVGTAYLYRSLFTLARIARILHRRFDADRYTMLAEQVRDAWNIEFLRQDGRTAEDSQASYVRAPGRAAPRIAQPLQQGRRDPLSPRIHCRRPPGSRVRGLGLVPRGPDPVT
ncbi:hypothetical protein AB0K16_44635 [Nonomuraea jabiensis]|uniref:alpha-L-rhamnosidase-related protein n=1 Tax=Nonomuraea jabiensis TaxID=882448 RepID=UPI00343A8E9F